MILSLKEITIHLQWHVNNAVKNNEDPNRKDINFEHIHSLAEAQKMVENVEKAVGDKTRTDKLNWPEFLKTGQSI